MAIPQEDELDTLFYEAKRRAVTLFHNDHDDGDTAIYQFISEIKPLINKRESRLIREAELDELRMASEFAEDVLQQFGYNGKSGGLSTLEWAEGIVKRYKKTVDKLNKEESKDE